MSGILCSARSEMSIGLFSSDFLSICMCLCFCWIHTLWLWNEITGLCLFITSSYCAPSYLPYPALLYPVSEAHVMILCVCVCVCTLVCVLLRKINTQTDIHKTHAPAHTLTQAYTSTHTSHAHKYTHMHNTVTHMHTSAQACTQWHARVPLSVWRTLVCAHAGM